MDGEGVRGRCVGIGDAAVGIRRDYSVAEMSFLEDGHGMRLGVGGGDSTCQRKCVAFMAVWPLPGDRCKTARTYDGTPGYLINCVALCGKTSPLCRPGRHLPLPFGQEREGKSPSLLESFDASDDVDGVSEDGCRCRNWY
ncbi:hypothetical protein ACHAWF_001702 [Thalassiosira exigua]